MAANLTTQQALISELADVAANPKVAEKLMSFRNPHLKITLPNTFSIYNLVKQSLGFTMSTEDKRHQKSGLVYSSQKHKLHNEYRIHDIASLDKPLADEIVRISHKMGYKFVDDC